MAHMVQANAGYIMPTSGNPGIASICPPNDHNKMQLHNLDTPTRAVVVELSYSSTPVDQKPKYRDKKDQQTM